MKTKTEEIKKCDSCGIKDKTTKETTVKENGAIGYYDVKVTWCNKCIKKHNYYLMASWGGYDF